MSKQWVFPFILALCVLSSVARAEDPNPKSPPSLFVYGDSTTDTGNNNYLRTIARCNIPPYGRDFDTHQPTGRFSNGRIGIDYLAAHMGIPFPRPHISGLDLSLNNKGANFASAGAGILNISGSDLGQHISMRQQLQAMLDLKKRMVSLHGEEETKKWLNNSVHYVAMGSNDFIHLYLANADNITQRISPDAFTSAIVDYLVEDLRVLIKNGVQKLAVTGIGALGCTPYYRNHLNATQGECAHQVNEVLRMFNMKLRQRVRSLYSYPHVKVTYCDTFDAMYPVIRDPTAYGFDNPITAMNACCGAGKYNGGQMCFLEPNLACPPQETKNHIWWDMFHPISTVFEVTMNNMWENKNGKFCDGMSLKQLVHA